MEGINFNKKFILIILLMGIIFCIFLSTNVNAVNMVLTKDAEFYDTYGVKLGIKLNKGTRLYLNGEKEVNGVVYRMTSLGSNIVRIKADALEFDNITVRNLVTEAAADIYDLHGKKIGRIEKGVKLDTAFNEGEEYFEVAIDGLIKAENFEEDINQDLNEDNNEDVKAKGGNFITKIIAFILNLFSSMIVNMVKI